MELRKDTAVVEDKVVLRFSKPANCPHCGEFMNAPVDNVSNLFNAFRMIIFSCSCPACLKKFAVLYKDNGLVISGGNHSHILDILYVHPRPHAREITAELRELSPRFHDLFSQSLRAEEAGDLDVAACGYRNAIEALIKDFSHVHKGVPLDERLTRKPLQACIEEYLDGLDETVSAYIVKEFGNGATHYPPIGEVQEFAEQREYLGIFLRHMSDKVKILNLRHRLPAKLRQKFDLPVPEASPPGEKGQSPG